MKRTTLVLGLSLSMTGCQSAPEPTEPTGLSLISADRVRGIEASYRDEVGSVLYLSARPRYGAIESTIALPGGTVVSRLSLPDREATPVEELIPAIRTAADAVTAEITTELENRIGEALGALYMETAHLEDAVVRFSLMYHEEVLAAHALGNGYLGEPCTVYHEQTLGTLPFHSADLHRFTVDDELAKEETGLICWSCMCDAHDRACANCDHWYCGWQCCAGTAPNGCGGDC